MLTSDAAAALSRQWKRLCKERKAAQVAFEEITKGSDKAMVEKWEQEAVEAMEKRFEDISAMDIYDVQKIKCEFPSLPSHFGHSHFGRERLCSAKPEGDASQPH